MIRLRGPLGAPTQLAGWSDPRAPVVAVLCAWCEEASPDLGHQTRRSPFWVIQNRRVIADEKGNRLKTSP
jgi:hypothetical protein